MGNEERLNLESLRHMKKSEVFKSPEKKNVEARISPGLVAKYSLFREKVNPKVNLVYHPSCDCDSSPSLAFPDSKVVYADINKNSIEALKRAGLDAHNESALEFDPGDVDVLIMLNPAISPEIPASYVVEGGHVLCNDYHGTASELHENEEFELKAIIRKSSKQELIFDTENLEDYWQEIDSEEEFKNAPFDWGAVNYQIALPVVKAVTGREENILEEYKIIVIMAQEQEIERNKQFILEHPESAEFLDKPNQSDILVFYHNDRQFVLQTILPKKKGTVDDIFVFQKKEEL